MRMGPTLGSAGPFPPARRAAGPLPNVDPLFGVRRFFMYKLEIF